MNLNPLMSQADAYHDGLQARSAAADEAYEAAYEAAECELTFDALLEALVDLPEAEKQAALYEAAQAKPTWRLAETYEHLLQAKCGETLQQASTCARQAEEAHEAYE